MTACQSCGATTRDDRLCVICAEQLAAEAPLSVCGCGQLALTDTGRCAACVMADRAPQGETVRLFEPAPAQLAGQQGLGL